MKRAPAKEYDFTLHGVKGLGMGRRKSANTLRKLSLGAGCLKGVLEGNERNMEKRRPAE